MSTADQLLYLTLSKVSTWDKSPSRNGPVARAPGLFITEYPSDFVPIMLSPLRDANPFFHLFEAFYFLAGRNDVDSCAYFASNMANYSDDGKTLFSSYGHRWVNHFKQDQLKALIQHLKEDPNSRRAVLQMWDANSDLPVLLSNEGLDLSCNYAATLDPQPDGSIDLNVNNRSNDLIFGAYGANMVHFNILHQYIAYALNRKKGVYRQISNNTHVYLEFPITKRFLDPSLYVTEDYYRDDPTLFTTEEHAAYHNQFDNSWNAWQASGQVADKLDDVISFLMSSRDELTTITEDDLPFDTPNFIRTVFVPMFLAFRLFKLVGAKEAAKLLLECQLEYKSSSPWYKAGREWLLRRIK